MPVRRAPPPSPVWLVLLLGIVMSMMLGSTYMRALRYQSSMPNVISTVQSNNSVGLGAIIPLMLVVLAVEAFGMPQHRHGRSPIFALVESVADNISFPLFISIILVLLLVGLVGGLNRPWQFQSASSPRCVYRGQRWHCMY